MLNFPQVDPQIAAYVAAGVVALIGFVVLRRTVRAIFARLRGRGSRSAPTAELNLEELAHTGPPQSGPSLQIYNVPVQLVILIIAPVGRGRETPSRERLPQIIDQIVPGLHAVVASHGTRIKLWPPQLSTPGFAAAMFGEFPLPGNRGKGTPWCAAAGRFSADGQSYLAGMVLRAAAVNNLSQFTLTNEAEWLEVLRCSM